MTSVILLPRLAAGPGLPFDPRSSSSSSSSSSSIGGHAGRRQAATRRGSGVYGGDGNRQWESVCRQRLPTPGLVALTHPAEDNHPHDTENDGHDDPADDLPHLGRRIAALAAQFIGAAPVTSRDEDTLEVLDAAQRPAALAAGRRRGRTGIALGALGRLKTGPVGVTALWAGFGFGRDLTATFRAINERHGRLR